VQCLSKPSHSLSVSATTAATAIDGSSPQPTALHPPRHTGCRDGASWSAVRASPHTAAAALLRAESTVISVVATTVQRVYDIVPKGRVDRHQCGKHCAIQELDFKREKRKQTLIRSKRNCPIDSLNRTQASWWRPPSRNFTNNFGDWDFRMDNEKNKKHNITKQTRPTRSKKSRKKVRFARNHLRPPPRSHKLGLRENRSPTAARRTCGGFFVRAFWVGVRF
jgi:hypothetical protein